jgi:hypothetical protein
LPDGTELSPAARNGPAARSKPANRDISAAKSGPAGANGLASKSAQAVKSGPATGNGPVARGTPPARSALATGSKPTVMGVPSRDSGAEAQAVIRGDWWSALEAEAQSAMPPGAGGLEAAEPPRRTSDVRRFVTSLMSDDRDTPYAPDPLERERPAATTAPASTQADRRSVTNTALLANSALPEVDLPPLATTPALEPDTTPSTLYAAPVSALPRTSPTYAALAAASPTDSLEPDGPRSAPLDLRELEEYEQGQLSRVRDEDEVLAYIGDEQRQQLWQAIARLYDEVPRVLVHDELQDEALQLLQGAQDILMERPRQFDVAKYKVGQVVSILTRRKQTTRWTNTYGWLTFLYEGAWIVVLSWSIFFAPAIVASITSTFGAAESLVSIEQLWNTAVWGGVGGVLGALYSLYWHAAKVKDFDKQYLMWYVVQPVIGLIIGAALHVIIGAGFLTLIGEPAVEQGTPLRLFPYALSLIAAFRQRFILEVVDRVIQFVTRTGDQDTTKSEQSNPSVGRAG